MGPFWALMGIFTTIEERDGVLHLEVRERIAGGGHRIVALLACALGDPAEGALADLLRVLLERRNVARGKFISAG